MSRIPGFAMWVVAIAATLWLPAPALGQGGGDGFLFDQPRIGLKFETGYGFQFAQNEIFDFLVTQHTLDRGDFDSPYIGGELAVRVSERWDVAIGVGYQSSSERSEFREFVGTDDLPIQQLTELEIIPVVVTAKYYPTGRGRSIGRFAWIPQTFSPFVSGGIGVASYRLFQDGEFVDFETLDIFQETFVTDRQAFLARAAAGLEIAVGRQFALSGEARYSWARSPLGEDYAGFGDIDLDGIQLVAGIAVRF